jgi:hypothetical protein
MKTKNYELTPRMIAEFCTRRLMSVFTQAEICCLSDYLNGLLAHGTYPPYRGARLDCQAIAEGAAISADRLVLGRRHIQPIFDALARSVAESGLRPIKDIAGDKRPSPKLGAETKGRGRRSKTIVEFPEPLSVTWDEPDDLGAAVQLHARRHGESIYHLYRAVVRPEDGFDQTTLMSWARGTKTPRSVVSLEILRRIERRYRLPEGYFSTKTSHAAQAATGHDFEAFSPSERKRLAWHLPDDFNMRPHAERIEILDWVRTRIISGSTDYRRYQAAAANQRFAVRFTCISGPKRKRPRELSPNEAGIIHAPTALDDEMTELMRFKTSTFAAFGMQRNGVWGDETAEQKVEHFGLWFGAFTAPAQSEVQGFGLDPARLTFAMMIFPQVWDWYLQWRERRRGFYTRWETDLLSIVTALTREETGWLRQTPRIADSLVEIEGLISQSDIVETRNDWNAACDRMHRHAKRRIKEINRVVRVHRDPFEPILPILEAPSPVAEYRKITEEILLRMPDERRHPRAAAEAVRSFLLLRIGLHTGLRQKNLRELLLCKRDALPISERRLEDMKRGEIRWSAKEQGWEILIPSVAFKNANSSFFGSKPFRIILPNLGGLYENVESYIDRHRKRLIGPAADSGTFFVKTAKVTSANSAYNQHTFYEAWRLVTQRYGVYNPWTGRGAIEGLLPHGPHNVRDVLATHILKQTGSYEQASYAIQDTPEMVTRHYGRFLPQDKAEIAARILNQVWEAA